MLKGLTRDLRLTPVKVEVKIRLINSYNLCRCCIKVTIFISVDFPDTNILTFRDYRVEIVDQAGIIAQLIEAVEKVIRLACISLFSRL